MKKTAVRILVIFVLIVSVLLFLTGCIPVLLAGGVREENALDINDENREYIESQLKYWAEVEDRDEVPDMQDAVRISYLVKFDDYYFKVEFNDQREYTLIINCHFPREFMRYIKSEGYNCYFHSDEFIADAVLPAISGSVAGLCIAYLVKHRRTSEESEDEKDVV